ncbi:MAG: allantoinase AllB [Candidatus Delongbacteria bacterium]
MSPRLFRNARVPAGGDATRVLDFLVEDGRFAWFDEPGRNRCPEACEIDLQGRLVLPGVIDGHVHFDDPGYTWRETFASGTRAAAAGGVTCVADMPCTSTPPVVSLANLRAKHAAVRDQALVDYIFWGGMCANLMEGGTDWRRDLRSLAAAGIGALKCYLHSGMDGFRAVSHAQLGELAGLCAELGLPLGVHAEDQELVLGREAALRAAGRADAEAFVESRPGEAERRAVRAVIQAARESGAHLHVVHLGSGAALEEIAAARRAGLRVSAETCPHYLAFTSADFARLGSRLKTAPPVKEESDRQRLWQGVREGDIAFLTTDHAAGEWPREKQTGSFWTDYGGIPGVELLLPWAWTAGMATGRLSLERLVDLLCGGPARFFGLEDRKGALRPGLDADFVLLGKETWTVRAEELHNLNRYTPFEGRELALRVEQTWLRGEQVWDRRGAEFPAAPGFGRLTSRGRRTHA